MKRVPDQMTMSTDSLVQEDDDVARERARLANTPPQELFSTDKLIISELSKYYGAHLAVNHISVGIPQVFIPPVYTMFPAATFQATMDETGGP